MRDLNPKGLKIEVRENDLYVDNVIKTSEELKIMLQRRPYWAKKDYDHTKYRGVVLNGSVLTKVVDLDEDSYNRSLSHCIKERRVLYYVRVTILNDLPYAEGPALLDMDSMPMHETWAKGISWPDKEYKMPSMLVDVDTEKPLTKMVGSFVGDMKCPNCGKSVNSMSGYTLHMKSCKVKPATTDGVIYTCTICGKKTISKYGLTNHMNTAHVVR
jgi:predicted RNA-binding Zn-ribbon protein involved in translation (DUF1610 family)